jgi:O-antigen ligase
VTLLRGTRLEETTQRLADFVLCGAPGAAIMAATDVALLVGFIALVGLVSGRGRWCLMLLGTRCGHRSGHASGTRHRRPQHAAVLILGSLAGLLALGALAFVLSGSQLSAVQRMMADISGTLSHGLPTDVSTAIRVHMYLGGFRAFLKAPCLDMTCLISQQLPIPDTPSCGAIHLLNDLCRHGHYRRHAWRRGLLPNGVGPVC